MAVTIFQHFIFQDFILPFLLIFTIVFAILEKTKILGEGKTQLDSIVAFVIGLIFVSFAYPKTVVTNMVLFLTVALIITFVILMLFSFINGEEIKLLGNKYIKWIVGGVAVIAVIIAILWATGVKSDFVNTFFGQSWSGAFWTNVLFIVVIAIAIALVLKNSD